MLDDPGPTTTKKRKATRPPPGDLRFREVGKVARSATSNGSKVLFDVDGRTSWARRFRDLCAQHAADMGGLDGLSQSQMSLIRRAATLEVELEKQEAVVASGGKFDIATFSAASGGLRRILETIGLKRVAKDVTPTLTNILRDRAKASYDARLKENKAHADD